MLTGNRSNFVYVEGATAWLYECPHHLSPLYIADQCYDKIPIFFEDTIFYVDPITRQTYDFATPIPCDNNPRNFIALDPDADEYYLLTPRPIKQAPSQLFRPKQIRTSISPNTYTAQHAGIYSPAELKDFWSRVLFAKHSDTTLKVLGHSLSYDIFGDDDIPVGPYSHGKSRYPNVVKYHTRDKLLLFDGLFSIDWFTNKIVALFGYPVYFLSQCGILYSSFLFLQAASGVILGFIKSSHIKFTLGKNITIARSLATGFFGVLSSSVVALLSTKYNRDTLNALRPKNSLSKTKPAPPPDTNKSRFSIPVPNYTVDAPAPQELKEIKSSKKKKITLRQSFPRTPDQPSFLNPDNYTHPPLIHSICVPPNQFSPKRTIRS